MKHQNHSSIRIQGSRPFRSIVDRISSSHLSRILLIGLLILCTCFIVSCPINKTANSAAQKDNSPINKTTDKFCRLARADRIDKVSVRYTRWNIQNSVRISEFDLLTSEFVPDWEIVAHRETASDIAMKLVEAFEKYQLSRSDIARSKLDFGLIAVFYSQGKEVLQIGVSRYQPAISINGELFGARPPYVVYALTTLLPFDAYREMFFYTMGEWSCPPYRETAGGLSISPFQYDPNHDPNETLEQMRKLWEK